MFNGTNGCLPGSEGLLSLERDQVFPSREVYRHVSSPGFPLIISINNQLHVVFHIHNQSLALSQIECAGKIQLLSYNIPN